MQSSGSLSKKTMFFMGNIISFNSTYNENFLLSLQRWTPLGVFADGLGVSDDAFGGFLVTALVASGSFSLTPVPATGALGISVDAAETAAEYDFLASPSP